MSKVEIEVKAWSGNVKPWRARVTVDGKQVGRTGFCRTENAARRAAEKIAAKHSVAR